VGYLVKIDADGSELWSRTYPSSLGEITATAVRETSDGGLIVGGGMEGVTEGARDSFLMKTDSLGNMTWLKPFEGSDAVTHGYDVVQTSNDTYVLVGSSDPYGGRQATDVLLIHYELGEPAPKVVINSLDTDWISIPEGRTLNMRVMLDAGNQLGVDGDWWISCLTPSGQRAYYNPEMFGSWTTTVAPSFQGPLRDTSPSEVLETIHLPPGVYRFSFAVDLNMNGTVDMDSLYSHQATVNIVARP
jgi:hypothetical protein